MMIINQRSRSTQPFQRRGDWGATHSTALSAGLDMEPGPCIDEDDAHLLVAGVNYQVGEYTK